MINFHYALQTCDSNTTPNRYCSSDKAEITKKCTLSFLQSIKNAAERDVGQHQLHNIVIVDDNSSQSTITYLKKLIDHFNCENINIELHNLKNPGIMNSIRYCYEWLEKNGIDIVYQVQDDYLFEHTAVFEMIDIFMQIYQDCNTDAIITGYNDSYLLNTAYKYKPIPRTIILGKYRYWMQIYDLSCTFLTSANQFKKNWDLYEIFLNLPAKGTENGDLESISLNYMLTQRNILGVSPLHSVALHLGYETEKDPYINWKLLWDSVNTSFFV